MSVVVYKTNVDDPKLADTLVRELARQFPSTKINFDLEDCDRVLRIEGFINDFKKIPDHLRKKGLECECLPD